MWPPPPPAGHLARECRLEPRRAAMLRGEPVNTTEGRAVLHTALRAPQGAGPLQRRGARRAGPDADLCRGGARRWGEPGDIRDVVNIGIGGSDLGPQMVVPALDAWVHPSCSCHFVSNVDGHDLACRCCAAWMRSTPCSSSPPRPSRPRRPWRTPHGAPVVPGRQGGTDIARHFVATTTNVEAAAPLAFTTTFGFWDWVGGRFSLWSAIGLPIALAVGAEAFRSLLAGAHAMDRHFAEAPLEANLPVQLGLMDVWYRNFQGYTSRWWRPYHQGLRRLPAYLQQLEMESNGKCVDLEGQPLPCATSPVVWGEAGHQRPACLFPDAAPGHRRDPGGVHRSKAGRVRTLRRCPEVVKAALADQHQSCWPTAWRRPGADVGQDHRGGGWRRRRRRHPSRWRR
jgi:glucose-6-phosphate isomerase